METSAAYMSTGGRGSSSSALVPPVPAMRSSSLDSASQPPPPTPHSALHDNYSTGSQTPPMSNSTNRKSHVGFSSATPTHSPPRSSMYSAGSKGTSSATSVSTMSRAESEALACSISSVLITSHQISSSAQSPTPSKRRNSASHSPLKSLFSNSYVSYMITVTTLSGDKWTVWRRYSNFVELDETLPEPTASELAGARKWGPTSDMSWNYETDSPTTVPFSPQTLPRPPLPPKTLNTHIPTRQAQLNTYLHMLLLNPAVRSHPSFLSFIGADQLLLTPTTANLTSFQYAFRSQAGFVGKTKDDVQEYFCNVL